MAKRSVLAITLALIISGVAQAATTSRYALKHPKREHCRAHYTRKIETVKRRKYGHTVKVRQTVCVKVKANAKLKTVAPPQAVKLHAHLDPSFTRDPSDPFKVTYAYSASATVESAALAHTANAEPTPLPEGVLSLYNDGLLACSVNVGGEAIGGECPVEYKALGAHTVTTIYTSGSTSATETSMEQVEPIGGSVSINVSYIPLEHSTLEPGESGCTWEGGGASSGCKRWLLGHVEITGSAITEVGAAPKAPNVSLDATVCDWTANSEGCGSSGGAGVVTVWATTDPEGNVAEIGLLQGDENLPSVTEGPRCNNTTCAWQTLQEGRVDIDRLIAGHYSVTGTYGDAGYLLAPATAALQFTPTITP